MFSETPPEPPADDEKRELLGNAIRRLTNAVGDNSKAAAVVLDGLRQGRIAGWTWSSFGFLKFPADFWVAPPNELAKRIQSSRASWLSTKEQWLFVERADIDTLERRHTKTADPEPYIFERTKARWPLYEACVWVATHGQDTNKERIAAEDLEEVGAVKLFSRLAEQPLWDGVYVFGRILRLGGRSQVMPGDWDTAHTGWADEGTEIRFRNAIEKKPGQPENIYMAADMHRFNIGGPSLVDLWIDRGDLFALFPEFAGAQRTNVSGKAAESASSALVAEPGAKTAMPTELVDLIAGVGRKTRNILEAAWVLWEGSWPRTLSRSERNAQVWDHLIANGWQENDPIGKDTWIEAFKRYDEIFPR